MNVLVMDREPQVDFQRLMRVAFEAMAGVPDFRGSKGRQHKLQGVLTLMVLGLAAGLHSLARIAAFGKRRKDLVRQLGLKRAPSHSTIWRVAVGVDREALRRVLDRVGGEELACRGSLVVAFDGKTMRSSRQEGGRAAQVVNAFEHNSGVVLGAMMSRGAGSELPAGRKLARELLRRSPQVAVVTGDALYAERSMARMVVAENRDYVFKLKKTSPTC